MSWHWPRNFEGKEIVAKRKPIECVHWPHMGPWGFYVGFTTSRKAFKREVKRLCKDYDFPFVGKGAGGTTHSLYNPKGELCCIITIDISSKPSAASLAGMIAHEAMHVVQRLWELVGETRPGQEAEAYLIQYIVVQALGAMERDKKGLKSHGRKTRG